MPLGLNRYRYRYLPVENLKIYAFSFCREKAVSEADTTAWLAWCEDNNRVKVQEYPVPPGVFPPGYQATVQDVKVYSLPDTRPQSRMLSYIPYRISGHSS